MSLILDLLRVLDWMREMSSLTGDERDRGYLFELGLDPQAQIGCREATVVRVEF